MTSIRKIEQWLKEQGELELRSLQEIPGDASFRRYFRALTEKESLIVMDASAQQDCFEPFLQVTAALEGVGVRVPTIRAFDRALSLMLLSDFGDLQYLRALKPDNADHLYQNALDVLGRIQACPGLPQGKLPHFNRDFMMRELEAFQEWFLEGYLKRALTVLERAQLKQLYEQLASAAEAQTQVFIHRDYHSANLMLLPSGEVGILDFQDACRGPVTYDLVSLLRDCYIDWPEEKVAEWLRYYHARLGQTVSVAEFTRWFDWMGLQRHMKALFIFARKYLRDQTERYLHFMPRTLGYVEKISARYPELAYLNELTRSLELPAFSMEA